MPMAASLIVMTLPGKIRRPPSYCLETEANTAAQNLSVSLLAKRLCGGLMAAGLAGDCFHGVLWCEPGRTSGHEPEPTSGSASSRTPTAGRARADAKLPLSNDGTNRRTAMRKMLAAMSVAAVTLAATLLPAAAQEWPNKPIRLICPYPPGAGADIS